MNIYLIYYVMSAILLTGSPATGKSTLCRELAEKGAVLLPRHTTRAPRHSDLSGEYCYLNRTDLLRSFLLGEYLESKINTLVFNGQCYATPREWVERIIHQPEVTFVAAPPSLEVTRELMMLAGRMIIWTHLTAPEQDRMARLQQRGISDNRELMYRLHAGEPGIHDALREAAINFDTSLQTTYICTRVLLQLSGSLLARR